MSGCRSSVAEYILKLKPGVLGLISGNCRPFHFPIFCVINHYRASQTVVLLLAKLLVVMFLDPTYSCKCNEWSFEDNGLLMSIIEGKMKNCGITQWLVVEDVSTQNRVVVLS